MDKTNFIFKVCLFFNILLYFFIERNEYKMGKFNNFIQNAASKAALNRGRHEIADYYNGQSIRKMTKDMILQFPMLVSQNVSVETAATLAGGFEAENTIMLRLLLQNDFGTLTNGSGDLISTLRMIHTNIEGQPGIFEESMMLENKRQSVPLEEKFCQWSLNESTLPKYLNEASEPTRNHSENKTTSDNRTNVNLGVASVEYNNKTTNSKNVTAEFSNDAPFNPDMFKKVNDLMPTFVKVKISISNSTEVERGGSVKLPFISKIPKVGGFAGKDVGVGGQRNISRTSLDEKEIIFGVKCIAHPIKSDDIIFNIGNEFKNSTFFKYVKWTTGEYGFFKGLRELIFDFDNMKNTGIQAAKTSNYWWFKLRKLKNDNKQAFFSSRTMKDAPIKTTTLVITKDEVDYIANTYRVDLSMPKFAQKLLNSLFLLNFAYVDESTEQVYLYDEAARSYTIKKIDDFKLKKKEKPLNIDDIKSLFGR